MDIRSPFLGGLWNKRKLILPLVFGAFVSVVAVELYRNAMAKGPNAAEIILPLFAFTIVLITLLIITYGMLLVRTTYVDFRNDLDDDKAVFVRMASDTLRTPLTGMRWITELLLGDDLGALNAKQRQSIAKMSNAIERLILLVNELLKIMKLSGGLIHYNAKPVLANDIMKGALDVVEALIEAKSQKLIVHAPEEMIHIEADLPLLQHVLQVLLSHASHLAPARSTIKIVVHADAENISYDIVFQCQHLYLRSIDQDIIDTEGDREVGEENAPNLTVTREILEAAHGSLHVHKNDQDQFFTITIPRKHLA